MLGQKINNLVSGEQKPGKYTVQWDGKDSRGREVASGVYLYSLETSDFTQLKKMILIK
jgi:flagellar hook assembly protein FlgD